MHLPTIYKKSYCLNWQVRQFISRIVIFILLLHVNIFFLFTGYCFNRSQRFSCTSLIHKVNHKSGFEESIKINDVLNKNKLFCSPDQKVEVSFTDHLLSVVRLSVCIFDFFSRTIWLNWPNLLQIILIGREFWIV